MHLGDGRHGQVSSAAFAEAVARQRNEEVGRLEDENERLRQLVERWVPPENIKGVKSTGIPMRPPGA